MSISRFEEVPVVHPGKINKEAAAMSQNPSIQYMFGVIIFMWLSTFSFLVMAAIWVLVRQSDTKGKKASVINIKDL